LSDGKKTILQQEIELATRVRDLILNNEDFSGLDSSDVEKLFTLEKVNQVLDVLHTAQVIESCTGILVYEKKLVTTGKNGGTIRCPLPAVCKKLGFNKGVKVNVMILPDKTILIKLCPPGDT
jgi:hypothetical protein